MRRRSPLPMLVAAVLGAIVVLSMACTSSAPVASNAVPPPATIGERVSFVTLGGNETLSGGLDDSGRQPWNQQVFASLPASATFANLAGRDATVADGLAEQFPKARDEEPTLATVWFGAGDIGVGTGISQFSSTLTDLVEGLQTGGAKVLLIARWNGDVKMSPFLDAIGEVASATGATLVSIEGHDSMRNPAEQLAVANAVQAAR